MFWVFLCCCSVIFVNTDEAGDTPLTWLDYVGWALFVYGFGCQVAADVQKYNFRADPANNGKFCKVGLWSVSRHPNFFGEMAMWWGIFLSVIPVLLKSHNAATGGWTVLSPIFTSYIMLFGTGMPQAEGDKLARFYKTSEGAAAWEDYRSTTSPLVPMPTGCYRVLPKFIKCLFFREWERYEYKVADADTANGYQSYDNNCGNSHDDTRVVAIPT